MLALATHLHNNDGKTRCCLCNKEKRTDLSIHTCQQHGELRCKNCQKQNKHALCDTHVIATTNTGCSPNTAVTTPLFLSPPAKRKHSHLSSIQRHSIVVLGHLQFPTNTISRLVPCSPPTVRHWQQHYHQHSNVKDAHRSGIHTYAYSYNTIWSYTHTHGLEFDKVKVKLVLCRNCFFVRVIWWPFAQ
jgi:hypothetical protein